VSAPNPPRPAAGGTTGADFWARILAGGYSVIPRWRQRAEDPPHAAVEALLAAELVAEVDRVAAELGVDADAVLFGAYATVLLALTGDPEVATGVLCSGRTEPLPVRIAIGDLSWAELVACTAASVAELRQHVDLTVARLRRLVGHIGPMFETVLDLSGGAPSLSAGLTLWVSFERAADGLRLRVASSVLDGGYLDRLVGYFVRALRQCAADPHIRPLVGDLLSSAELAYQIDGLAGPTVNLPDRRAHELFEDRAREHPNRLAIHCGSQRLTYRELNERANRIAHAVAEHRVHAEDVVAVVLDRDPDWAAAVLGIFKAGAVYLPIEPEFPAERVTAMLRRSGCRLAVSAPGCDTNLRAALPADSPVVVLSAPETERAGGPVTNPGVPVAANRLAYVYFTSGSTGEPKGAMCEHAGMLNHLLAKIEDLGITDGTVVAQTAPQCFDISLWQLVAPLLVGGTAVLVDQEVILDPQRFLTTIDASRVEVLQLVPSYVEVLLNQLAEQGQQPQWLRCLSVTGEKLKPELAARCFAALPGRTLVNAYGLTETSDDTNHNVLTGLPAGEHVSLGPPVRNVRIYVVDDSLAVVPLGAPGEIVFSGVCVGRGYINDEQRTREAYLPDPYRPGQRIYRSGDFGRWLPDGSLAFLGRRDSQVKVRGFRVELGDVENQLLGVPGVRDAAVVVTGETDQTRSLVAFYLADTELTTIDLRAAMASKLPNYLIPERWQQMATFPLNANGKVDRTALRALASERITAERTVDPPRTDTERRLAAAWAEVLGVPVDEVGRDAHFFERGGTSLSAVRLLIRLERRVSLRDLDEFPTLAALAQFVDAKGTVRTDVR
jgi:amino acid adenylation domain-containing protein